MTQWQAGMIVTAERLAAISPYDQPWSPNWTTSNGMGDPSFGNASLSCTYAISGGRCFANFNFQAGSTTNWGTGGSAANYLFGLPVPTSAPGSDALGHFELAFNGSTERLYGVARVASSTHFEIYVSSGTVGNTTVATALVDSGTPWTWSTAGGSPSIKGTLSYPIA